mmetsp:Transcript_22461/g.34902  ORF Transcript_22461/g.34902 Transcript_22461/m.34902 type:complete len:186 (-) Transcript_22461:9-566(-)
MEVTPTEGKEGDVLSEGTAPSDDEFEYESDSDLLDVRDSVIEAQSMRNTTASSAAGSGTVHALREMQAYRSELAARAKFEREKAVPAMSSESSAASSATADTSRKRPRVGIETLATASDASDEATETAAKPQFTGVGHQIGGTALPKYDSGSVMDRCLEHAEKRRRALEAAERRQKETKGGTTEL